MRYAIVEADSNKIMIDEFSTLNMIFDSIEEAVKFKIEEFGEDYQEAIVVPVRVSMA